MARSTRDWMACVLRGSLSRAGALQLLYLRVSGTEQQRMEHSGGLRGVLPMLCGCLTPITAPPIHVLTQARVCSVFDLRPNTLMGLLKAHDHRSASE